MSSRSSSRLLALVAVLAMVAAAAPASAHPAASPAQSRRAATIAFWTPARVRAAVPRDYVLDKLPDQVVPLKKGGVPGGGGGHKGGGGGGTTVTCPTTPTTGTTWTCGGLVTQTTGKVLFSIGNSYYVCSGSVVTDSSSNSDISVVLTAGHCVYDEGGSGFVQNWMFVPDYQASPTFTCADTAYGCWTPQALVTTQAWTQGDFNYDVGFAVVGLGGKNTAGDATLDATVGSQSIVFNANAAENQDIYDFGYPQARPYNGNDLVYCAGTETPDPVGGSQDQALACDMTGGSSGGPWYQNFDKITSSSTFGTGQTVSVNSFKYRSDKTTMYGPYFGTYVEGAYTKAEAAPSGNTVVDASGNTVP